MGDNVYSYAYSRVEVKAKNRDTLSLSKRHSDYHILSGSTQWWGNQTDLGICNRMQWVPTNT